LVEALWGWTRHPAARALWLQRPLLAAAAAAEAEEEDGDAQRGGGTWARLFGRLARTTYCLEPGAYRRRFWEDYMITIDIQDTAKVCVGWGWGGLGCCVDVCVCVSDVDGGGGGKRGLACRLDR
jgi:hypothetical protein